MSDPPIYTAGAAIVSMSSLLLGGEVTTDYVIMPAAEVQQAGTLIGFEYFTDIPGTVEFYVSLINSLSLSLSLTLYFKFHILKMRSA